MRPEAKGYEFELQSILMNIEANTD